VALCGRPQPEHIQVNDATAVTFSVKCLNPLKLYPLSGNIFRKWFASYFLFTHEHVIIMWSPTVNFIAVTTLLLTSGLHHRLRGSASTVLTTGQVNGRWANFDPLQNWNPWADCNKIPHNWLRPWEDTLNQIWYKSIHWGLLGIWVKYNVFVPFLFIYLFIPFFLRLALMDFYSAVAH